ncbi:hypothetical protein [Lignipirellula cremea]|uniref:Uncharacterized protein n=1 Tax=Lignipirellula cremea TaxID=2528010 RepID=A0A518DSG1_9BACT|nr:hypothetical protein [Lignipirellula cremea]QDU94777.1 hypothetical protein Pla8534_25840 [Lignipirellula cremea]
MKFLLPFLAVWCCALSAWAGDWNAAPSYFTHNPQTGERVDQYAPDPIAVGAVQPANYQKSGYRQYRSSLQVGSVADNIHVVEEYGRPVRPYGEWRFPYRPYSVPYGAWGPQGYGGGFGGYGNIGFGGGFPRQAFEPYGSRPFNDRTGVQPPYYDGTYPQNRIPPRLPSGGFGHQGFGGNGFGGNGFGGNGF